MNDYRKTLLKSIGVTAENEEELTFHSWNKVSSGLTLSEEFIREFQNKLNWDLISYHQNLSENFIREFQTKVFWKSISTTQKLSDEFLLEFHHKIDWERFFFSQKPSMFIVKKFITKSSIREIETLFPKDFKNPELQEIQRKLDLKYLFEK